MRCCKVETYPEVNDSDNTRLQLGNESRVTGSNTVLASSTRQHNLVNDLLVVDRGMRSGEVQSQLSGSTLGGGSSSHTTRNDSGGVNKKSTLHFLECEMYYLISLR